MKKVFGRIGMVANITLGVIIAAFVAMILIAMATGLFEGDTPMYVFYYVCDWDDLCTMFWRSYLVYMPIAQIVTAIVALVKKFRKR